MTSAQRHIVVVTGTRAEFGLLLPVMRAIEAHHQLQLRTIVTGLHWVQNTAKDIKAAGIRIDAKVIMQKKIASNSRTQTACASEDAAALGRGITGITQALLKLTPDVVLVLGDRIEAFAAACAAGVGQFGHIAHLHGGDRAQGVADDAMRHAISKLSHLHFAATTQSRQRLIRLGENPDHIWNVGSSSLDGLAAIPPVKERVEPYAIVLHHSCGRTDAVEQRVMKNILKATKFMRCVVLGSNHDPGYRGIEQAIKESSVKLIEHLPRDRFVGLLKGCSVLVGNSSAGLIEAAAARPGGVPVVNIGPRQWGRQRPANVIDCEETLAAIGRAVKQALANPPRARVHPYGQGDTGKQIAAYLAKLNLNQIPLGKCNAY